MIVPHHLDLRYIAEHAGLYQVVRCNLVGFAAVLCSHLHDYFALEHGIASSFGFFQDVSHWLLDIGMLAGIGRHFQQWRMRVVGRGENYGINLLVGERVFDVLKCTRCATVVLSVGGNSSFAVVTPQVANRVHFHVVT